MELAFIGSVPDHNFTVPTIKVVNQDAPDGFIIINKADFDPAVHAEYGASDGAATTGKKKSPAKAAAKTDPQPEGQADQGASDGAAS